MLYHHLLSAVSLEDSIWDERMEIKMNGNSEDVEEEKEEWEMVPKYKDNEMLLVGPAKVEVGSRLEEELSMKRINIRNSN